VSKELETKYVQQNHLILRYRGSQKCSVPGQFTQLFCYLKDEFIRSKNGFMCFGWFAASLRSAANLPATAHKTSFLLLIT
jgi:hypothetical protein